MPRDDIMEAPMEPAAMPPEVNPRAPTAAVTAYGAATPAAIPVPPIINHFLSILLLFDPKKQGHSCPHSPYRQLDIFMRLESVDTWLDPLDSTACVC